MPLLLQPRDAYDLWAETYPATAHNPLMQAEQSVVARLLAQVEAKRALDVGTGSGRYLSVLASTGASVVGIDRSMPMLAHVDTGADSTCRPWPAANRHASPYVVCGDACALPFRRATFDLVNASLMVGDLPDLRRWAQK